MAASTQTTQLSLISGYHFRVAVFLGETGKASVFAVMSRPQMSVAPIVALVLRSSTHTTM